MLRELRHTSPASALEELLVGSRGSTALQISAALHIPMESRVSAYFDRCDREIPNRRRSDLPRCFDMGYLNNVHHEQTLVAMDAEAHYGDRLRLERFSWVFVNATEESREGIDNYARLYANPFEPSDILPKGCITPSSLECMVSVVNFRGSWKQAFDDSTVTGDIFHELDGSVTSVVMVHQTGRFRVAMCADLSATAIELPYELVWRSQGLSSRASISGLNTLRTASVTPATERTCPGPEFSLVVMLPDDKDGLTSLEEKLSALTALRCFSNLKQRGQVQVSLYFKVKQVIDLAPVMSALGVRDVFTDSAELWGSKRGDKRVTLMRHAAAFETARSGGRRSSRTKQPQSRVARLARALGALLLFPRLRPRVFSVDRPFVFFVTCSRPDAVMLLGSVRKISR
ncbi:ipis-1-like isoform X2 [Dermacentor albipictus]